MSKKWGTQSVFWCIWFLVTAHTSKFINNLSSIAQLISRKRYQKISKKFNQKVAFRLVFLPKGFPLYITTQWSCSASGSMWEMLDSNSGLTDDAMTRLYMYCMGRKVWSNTVESNLRKFRHIELNITSSVKFSG